MEQADAVQQAKASASQWLARASPKDTEDQVFRLLSLGLFGADPAVLETAASQLTQQQRDDGGWGQRTDLDSDAYATGTVLYALRQAGAVSGKDRVRNRGVQFLLKTQQDDGSWFVHSRSNPFQPYYETGFPHREDQFISTSATAWATLVLLQSLPEE